MKVKSSNLVFVIIWTFFNILDVAKAAGKSQRSSPSRDSRSSSKKPQLGTSSSATLKLEHISVLFAHGVTCPKKLWTTIDIDDIWESHWRQKQIGGHEYTAPGLIQMELLGRALNLKYKESLGVRTSQVESRLVNEGMPPISGILVSEIVTSSSDSDLTLACGRSARNGLTQRLSYAIDEKIAIHPDHPNLGKCPKLEISANIKKKEKLNRVGDKYKKLIQHFNTNVPPSGDFKVGDSISTAEQLWIIMDNVVRERASGIKAQSMAIRENYAEYVKFYFEYMEAEYGLDVQIVNELRIGQLLRVMVEKINEFVSPSSSSSSVKSSSSSVTSSSSSVIPKIRLYSSHDVTVISFLKALGVNPSNEIYQRYGLYPVLPGSSVILELYSRRSSIGKEYFVQVVYNKDLEEHIKTVPLWLSGCSGVMCPLDAFLKKANGLALTPKQFQDKCNKN